MTLAQGNQAPAHASSSPSSGCATFGFVMVYMVGCSIMMMVTYGEPTFFSYLAALVVGVAGIVAASSYRSRRARAKREVAIAEAEAGLRAAEAAMAAAQQEHWRLLVEAFGEQAAGLILAGRPWQGATQDMVGAMLGNPADVSTKVLKTKTNAVWRYNQIAANRYALKIHFEDGVCVGWEDN